MPQDHRMFCDMPPTQAGIIPGPGTQYLNTSDTYSMITIKDTAYKSRSDVHMSVLCTDPQMALHWLLISFPTASIAHA